MHWIVEACKRLHRSKKVRPAITDVGQPTSRCGGNLSGYAPSLPMWEGESPSD